MVLLPCSPCCGGLCEATDKPYADAAAQGMWHPSGNWGTRIGNSGVSWSFVENDGTTAGNTYFFYGSSTTSRPGGGASGAEVLAWDNPCNWYTAKTTAPNVITSLAAALSHRSARVPPSDAIVHIYTDVSTESMLNGQATAKNVYFWNASSLLLGSTLSATHAAHDSVGGVVFVGETFLGNSVNSGNRGTINGGVTFNLVQLQAVNAITAVVNGGARFIGEGNAGTVNGGARFEASDGNLLGAVVNGGAQFYGGTINEGTVNGGATFFGAASAFGDPSINIGLVNGGAVFYGAAKNGRDNNTPGVVNDGAVFNDSSRNYRSSTVNGTAVFNEAACSERDIGSIFATPCTRKFVTNDTELPVCNGTAPSACSSAFLISCGCG
jgi:hypothetical protein